MTKIVVIGGTGLIGSKVVARLVEHGHEAIAASPKSGVNTLTGEGLAEVLSGAQVVVDGSNSPSFEDKAALDFFTTSTGNLLAAEKTANAMLDVAPPPTPERATGTKGLRTMGTVSPGFKGRGRHREPSAELPPGQYLVEDFPVLSAGPTPSIDLQDWEFIITNETGDQQRWDWNGFRGLPSEPITVDLHCVTHWSKLATSWEGVSLDTLLAEVETSASFALAESYGGYSTNLPLEDLTDGKAWIAFRYDGQELEAEHGGPARLLVPHLYFWKSAKWVRGIRLLDQDEPGFWESLGYHNYGDPWLEQRYWGD